ncbi:vWA domain-containing protein [Photobacterium carnosum]|uniref:vWA domain-containing protein n=1 Tax=Photobacterium carnosum TaxID=2023717 RepID=UPI001E658F3B|nr:VWA domain-containing protein [Photobacterium carnosum]MCD9529709.1 VWA domain-containing protein [Photobacterium carnosum]MCF2155285.1 VWA domain-containing protein [Photobacterium carnosum]MCF2217157.1 VWA domain-containing protein [Photobacterium carnosum]
MFEFVWLWAWALLPLAWLVYRLSKPVAQPAAIHLPQLPQGVGQKQPSSIIRKVLMSLVWVSLVCAIARPVWYGDPIEIKPEHRDMLLAVDLSGSMAIPDMVTKDGKSINRLAAVKHVLSDFIAKRKGDRLGLVIFADHGYLQTPLTFDRKTVEQQLNRTVLDLIGQSTAIGEGLGVATKTFIDSKAPQRVIILLSDGGNTSGVIGPIEAAKLAQESHVKIYTVGVGADKMIQKGFFGDRVVNPSSDLDEKTLSKIAAMTGGEYFRARNPQQLEKIYDVINKLQPVNNAQQTWRPRDELFRYPLALALLLSVIIAFMRKRHG